MMKQFEIIQNNTRLDVVMYPPEYTADRVKRSLVAFDGYPADIQVQEFEDLDAPQTNNPIDFSRFELAAAAAAIEPHYYPEAPRFNSDPDGAFKKAKIEARAVLVRQFAALDAMTAPKFYQLTGRNKRAKKH